MPDPCTIMLDDPVPATLPARIELIIGTSADTASVMLPTNPPAVTATTSDPRKVAADWHLKDVSETQVVASQSVAPALIFWV